MTIGCLIHQTIAIFGMDGYILTSWRWIANGGYLLT